MDHHIVSFLAGFALACLLARFMLRANNKKSRGMLVLEFTQDFFWEEQPNGKKKTRFDRRQVTVKNIGDPCYLGKVFIVPNPNHMSLILGWISECRFDVTNLTLRQAMRKVCTTDVELITDFASRNLGQGLGQYEERELLHSEWQSDSKGPDDKKLINMIDMFCDKYMLIVEHSTDGREWERDTIALNSDVLRGSSMIQ
jgi:hypothetical protein